MALPEQANIACTQGQYAHGAYTHGIPCCRTADRCRCPRLLGEGQTLVVAGLVVVERKVVGWLGVWECERLWAGR